MLVVVGYAQMAYRYAHRGRLWIAEGTVALRRERARPRLAHLEIHVLEMAGSRPSAVSAISSSHGGRVIRGFLGSAGRRSSPE
eukprot:scaffold108940_cov38-Tisochrysis_lutea.AAC.2